MNITLDMLYKELQQFEGKIIMLTIWTESGKSRSWNGVFQLKKDETDGHEDMLNISISTGSLTEMTLDVSTIEEYESHVVPLEKEDKFVLDLRLCDSSTITFATKVKKENPAYTDIQLPDKFIKYLFQLPI